MTSDEVDEKIVGWLYKEYGKYGRNFTFRVKNVAKGLNVSSHLVFMRLRRLEEKEVIKIFSKSRKRTVYKTCFNGDAK